ncbi:MAG: hypothetical protein WCG27_08860, partial [Pseudomonadota bacterium]
THELQSPFAYLSIFITHFLVPPVQNPTILRKMYLEMGLSLSKIAQITGWSKTCVCMAIKNHKLWKKKKGERS